MDAYPLDTAHPGDDPNAAPNSGVVVTAPDAMIAIFRRAIAAGFPISIHAIGYGANREGAGNLFEELAVTTSGVAIPHRIEHVQLLNPADTPPGAPQPHCQRATRPCA